MNAIRFLLIVSTILFSVSSAFADYAKLTPAWAKSHPGRLTLETGTAFGGWTDYNFYMHFDDEITAEVRATALIDLGGDRGKRSLHSFGWAITQPSKRIRLHITTPSFTPPPLQDIADAKPDATLHILIRQLDENGQPSGRTDEYDLILSDFAGIYTLPVSKRDERRADEANSTLHTDAKTPDAMSQSNSAGTTADSIESEFKHENSTIGVWRDGRPGDPFAIGRFEIRKTANALRLLSPYFGNRTLVESTSDAGRRFEIQGTNHNGYYFVLRDDGRMLIGSNDPFGWTTIAEKASLSEEKR
jgi:hypothetical protein